MMREVAELANVDRAALWHQLRATEDNTIGLREEEIIEVSSLKREKAVISQRELSDQIQEIESQLDWLRSEQDEDIAKLTAEKRAIQDSLHDAEIQLVQLKSRKRDELKVAYYLHFLSSL
ncbi:hypothetical protein Nepgr_008868 [Nepenthes gracilis]|uniref:Uncharacterized protein n=1 Tax=Nepenthes gracilis TaxID=150966 RepID=A0AAD3S9R3_NEPGR|nr:hypothetical protein Nepgr_008868 [Nepenthes gracilis]